MKYLKYIGLYFMIASIGYNFLKYIDANGLWIVLFMCGNGLYYLANLWEEDS